MGREGILEENKDLNKFQFPEVGINILKICWHFRSFRAISIKKSEALIEQVHFY